MKINKIQFMVVIIILFMLMTGCSKADRTTDSDVIGKYINNDSWENIHAERLKEKETPYTLFFKNTDKTYSMYIFGSPISFYDSNDDLVLINTDLISTQNGKYKQQGYAFQTANAQVISYFPKNIDETYFMIENEDVKLLFGIENSEKDSKYKKNIYHDIIDREHQSLVYQIDNNTLMECVPTNLGIMARIVLNESNNDNKIVFFVNKMENADIFACNNQYCKIVSDMSELPSIVIRCSSLMDSSGNVSVNNKLFVEETPTQWKITVDLDKVFLNDVSTVYPVEIAPTFEFYSNNIPDSAIYENAKNDNFYLSDFAIIGNSQYLGLGSQYSKFRTHYIFETFRQNIKSASYTFVALIQNNTNPSINVFRLKDFWKSTAIAFEDHPLSYRLENTVDISVSGMHSVDITEYIRDCVHDDTQNMDDYGLLFSCMSDNEYAVVSTYDNSFYQPYVKIDFYVLPWRFEPLQEINPNPLS